MSNCISAANAEFCYLDLDFHQRRQKLANAAAFVKATNSRYGFSSSDLWRLGGSEVSRIEELVQTDHEWSASDIETRPPVQGNRLVVKLFWDVAPIACENFATLCANGSVLSSFSANGKPPKSRPVPLGDSGKPLTYRGSIIHRIVPGFIAQGGDFVMGNGSGGESIYNKKFKDEKAGLNLKHNRRGVLSMGNAGKNSNSSQFFFTFAPASICDGKHVVFGRIVSGWPVLDALEKIDTSTDGCPDIQVLVTDCGIWTPLHDAGAGYWYDRPDANSYAGVSSIFMVRPRVTIVVPSSPVAERFIQAMDGGTSNCCLDLMWITVQDTDSRAIVSRIEELLENFSVDLVLVAPTCQSDIIPKIRALPPRWIEQESNVAVPLNKVIMCAKPIEALSMIRSQSWLSSRPWSFDGLQ